MDADSVPQQQLDLNPKIVQTPVINFSKLAD